MIKQIAICLLFMMVFMVKNDESCLEACMSECVGLYGSVEQGNQCSIACLEKCVINSEYSYKDDYQKNYCLNGVSAEELTNKQYLLEFAKGPCSPLLVLPGIMATKLIVEIDCLEFQEHESAVFEQCGFTDCTKEPYEFWKKVPKSEYQLWVPSYMDPMSFVSLSEKYNLCFAYLISYHVNLKADIKNLFKPRKGVKVKLYGYTKSTKDDNKCGSSAISDLLPISIQVRQSKGYRNLFALLEHIGYSFGLTVQPVPYNFSLSYKHNEVAKGFKEHLKRLNKLTGKRTTIVAHSMGNLNALYQLSSLTKEEKRKLVYNYVSISPPFLGASKIAKTFVAGNNDFITLSNFFGFHFSASVLGSMTQASLFEMMPKDIFRLYSDEPFFKRIRQRMEYEEKYPEIGYENSGVSFWPPLKGACYDNTLTDVSPDCSMGLFNTGENSIITIAGKSYKLKDFGQLLYDYPLNEIIKPFYDKTVNDDLTTLNPGVPMVVVFMNAIPTEIAYEYGADFTDYTLKNLYPKAKNVVYGRGDKTVPTYSQLILPLKWALDHDEDPLDDRNQPVKFVDFCSKINRETPVYDNSKDTKDRQVKTNGYLGLQCECNGNTSSYIKCPHNSIHSDINVVKLVVEVADAGQKPSETDLRAIEELKEEDLIQYKDVCSQLDFDMFNDDT